MERYLKFVIFPAAILIIATCFIAPEPPKDNIKEYISKAIDTGNKKIAVNEYKKLVKSDVNNIENHRGYISTYYSLRKTSKSNNYGRTIQEDSEIVNYYTNLSVNADCNISDVGLYCLGLIKATEHDYKGALIQYSTVRNPDLPYLNNSIGYCYKELGDFVKAKSYLKKEIALGTYISGAIHNISYIYYREHNTEQMHALIDNPEYTKYISSGFKRTLAYMEDDIIAYSNAMLASLVDRFTIYGITGAMFICAIWLLFIKRLDLFEPERLCFLILILFISILFSRLAYPLYDFFHITLSFEMGNTPFHQLAYCIFGIGFTEELIKLFPFFSILYFTKQINESTDYIIYTSVSALGFAIVENIGYFDTSGLRSISGRAVTATFFHMALSSFAIYGFIYAKYKHKSFLYFILSFSIACLLHGLYDFFLVVKGPLNEFKVFSFLIFLFAIPCYARIFRNVLCSSEYFKLGYESSLRDNAFLLICGLSYIIVFQFIVLAFKYGPSFANHSFTGSVFGSFFILLLTYSQFANIKPSHNSWISVFNK